MSFINVFCNVDAPSAGFTTSAVARTEQELGPGWVEDDVYPPLAELRRALLSDPEWAALSSWEKDLWEMSYRPDWERLACIEEILKCTPAAERAQKHAGILDGLRTIRATSASHVDILPKPAAPAASVGALDIDAVAIAALTPATCWKDGRPHDTGRDGSMAVPLIPWATIQSFSAFLEDMLRTIPTIEMVYYTESLKLFITSNLQTWTPTSCSSICFNYDMAVLAPVFRPEMTPYIMPHGRVLRPEPWPSFIDKHTCTGRSGIFEPTPSTARELGRVVVPFPTLLRILTVLEASFTIHGGFLLMDGIWGWSLHLLGRVKKISADKQDAPCNLVCLKLQQLGLFAVHLTDGNSLCSCHYTAAIGDTWYGSGSSSSDSMTIGSKEVQIIRLLANIYCCNTTKSEVMQGSLYNSPNCIIGTELCDLRVNWYLDHALLRIEEWWLDIQGLLLADAFFETSFWPKQHIIKEGFASLGHRFTDAIAFEWLYSHISYGQLQEVYCKRLKCNWRIQSGLVQTTFSRTGAVTGRTMGLLVEQLPECIDDQLAELLEEKLNEMPKCSVTPISCESGYKLHNTSFFIWRTSAVCVLLCCDDQFQWKLAGLFYHLSNCCTVTLLRLPVSANCLTLMYAAHKNQIYYMKLSHSNHCQEGINLKVEQIWCAITSNTLDAYPRGGEDHARESLFNLELGVVSSTSSFLLDAYVCSGELIQPMSKDFSCMCFRRDAYIQVQTFRWYVSQPEVQFRASELDCILGKSTKMLELLPTSILQKLQYVGGDKNCGLQTPWNPGDLIYVVVGYWYWITTYEQKPFQGGRYVIALAILIYQGYGVLHTSLGGKNLPELNRGMNIIVWVLPFHAATETS